MSNTSSNGGPFCGKGRSSACKLWLGSGQTYNFFDIVVSDHVGHLILSFSLLLPLLLFPIIFYPSACVVGVLFALPLVMFSAAVAIFLYVLGLLRILGLVDYILFCLPLTSYVEQSMINLLVREVLFCHLVLLEVLHQRGDFVEEESSSCMGGSED